MKKIFYVLLFALLCLFLLSACDDACQHTYEYIPHEAGHFKQYTCGCPSPDILEEHYDRNGDLLCDACKLQISIPSNGIPWQYNETHHWWTLESSDGPVIGMVYAYGEHENHDADLFCDICGYYMAPQPPANHFLRNQAGCTWLSEITAENIAKIKMTAHAEGVAPGTFKTVTFSEDEAVIQSIFEEYYWLDTAPVSGEHAQVPGGGVVTVAFILKDGTEKSITLYNSHYCDESGNWFKLHSIPTFKEGDNYVVSYGFVTYEGTAMVWACDPIGMEGQFVCEIATDELEFIDLLDELVLDGMPVIYRVDTEFGTLHFLSETYFYIVGVTEGKTKEQFTPLYFQLVGKNLEELIDDAQYSLSIDREEWLYEDLPSHAKAGERISVKINIVYDIGLMLFVNGKEVTSETSDTPYLEYVFTMPESDVTIHVATYDGFVPDENYFVLCRAYLKKNPNADFAYIRHYYGEFACGAIVAMIDAGDYPAVVWCETVDGETFYYTDGNRITVLYEGEFYTLTEAYANGYITAEELKDIAEKHLGFSIKLY